MNRRQIVAAVLTACAVAGVTGAAQADDLARIDVGWGLTAAVAPAMIALDKGYFRQLGLAPEIMEFRGSANALSALATGELDVDLGGVTAGFYNSAARGFDVRVVAPLSIQPGAPGTTPLVARKDLWDAGVIRSAADLKGRKVAVNAPGNGIEYKLAIILDAVGLSLNDVDLTQIGFPEMMVALQNRAIDAAVPAQPFGTLAVQQNLGVIMMKESEAGHGDVTTVVLFGGKFIREQRPLAVRYLQGIVAGIRDLSGDGWKSPRNVGIMAKYIHIKPEILLADVFPEFDPTLAIATRFDSLRRQEAIHRRDHRLDYQTPLDPAAVIDPTLAKEAVATMPQLKPE
jgi:NitT/TauT family transport system substrate-binding protein